MKTVDELEAAVQDLPPEDLAEFRRWFAAFDAAAWDRDLEADATSGKLDRVAEEALAAYRAGRTQPL